MADTKISAMAAASALSGTEAIPAIQGGANVKTTPAQISTYLGTWTDWTPTLTGFSGTPTVTSSRYCLIGKMCTAIVVVATGTSNNATTTITLPFNSARTQFFVIGTIVDNGVVSTGAGRLDLSAASNIATVRPTLNAASWSAAGTKTFSFSITYEVA